MNDSRWRRIQDLYHAALQQDAARRSAFLKQACPDDDVLRHEVESLLGFEGREHEMLEKPAWEYVRTSALVSGAVLGNYRVIERIGAGGMGEVYRAADLKLNRQAALKVLPEMFSRDPERMARFSREAQILASLNHPNIAAIYGLEESGATRALAMELVEGPTLADRLGRGPVPPDEALAIATQIVEALAYAHEKQVVHRDLKPANIKVTPEGSVKVLDFGLAKAAETEDTLRFGDPATSPTDTMPPTRAGMILGTAGYMSPEQARGRLLDRRTDIWSFGAVFYEMLSGRRAFEGESIPDVLAVVLNQEPDWERIPERFRRLLQSCLEKDRQKRLQAIGDWHLALAAETIQPARPRLRLTMARWAVAISALALLATLTLRYFRQEAPQADPVRFKIQLPRSQGYAGPPLFVVSPDGRKIAIVSVGDANNHMFLYVRSLDTLEIKTLADMQYATLPFWSPDSKYIAFPADGKLKKVEASGGPAQPLCNLNDYEAGGTWSKDGVIIFGTASSGLFRVPDTGGTPSPLTAGNGLIQLFPAFLPDGRHFLYSRVPSIPARENEMEVYLGSLDDAQGNRSPKPLLKGASNAVYIAPGTAGPASDTGYLLFSRQSSLMAQHLEVDKLQLTGDPVPVADPVGKMSGFAFYTASNNTLAYLSVVPTRYQLTWLDREGKPRGNVIDPDARDYSEISISPDGAHVAIDRTDSSAATDVWVYELGRNLGQPLTVNPSADYAPVWSPDGKQIVFASDRDGRGNLYIKSATGAGAEQLLSKSDEPKTPNDWSSKNGYLIYTVQGSKTKNDLWMLPMTGDRTPKPFLATEFNEGLASFSPDGRYVAYISDKTGMNEIYVQSFPKPSEEIPISKGGGVDPRWSHDGKEIFYISGRTMKSVSVSTSPTFRVNGLPKALFDAALVQAGAWFRNNAYDISVDGKGFLATLATNESAEQSITVFLNWQAALTKPGK
jgi:serine/threonine protein kinase/Tol biopolymer transport system component